MQTCKSCGVEKEARFLKLGKNGALLYVDEQGKLWKGKCCSTCQANKRKEQRRAAKAKSSDENPG